MNFDLHQSYQNAVTLHQAGRLSEAEGIYRNILAVDPKHTDSLHLLGVIALQVGRNEIAVDLIGQAIAANKRNADFHNNIGVALRALGRLDEAIDHFKRALKLKPDYADAHNNLGLCLKEQGQLAEAEARYRRALSIWPDHADAHNNLGIVLAEQGKFIEAEEQYRQAMNLKAGFPDPHNNLGLALMWQGKIAEAVALYRQALALKPDYLEAYTNLAMALVTAEEFAVALAALRCAFGLKETNEARSLVVHCLKHWRSTQDIGDLRDFVSRALSEGWDRPVELARVSAAIIKKNPGVGESIARATNAWPRRLSADELWGASGLAAACEDQLLRCLLESTPIWDIEMERFLTAARFALLQHAAAETASAAIEAPVLGFYCALARQCFINEYVFACGDDELEAATGLRDRLAAALASGAAIPALWPVAVAAYFPLYTLSDAERLLDRSSSDSWSDAVIGVLVQQISEPREERQIQPTIPRLTAIEDAVSLLVQQQYEENPYPRWVRAVTDIKPMTVDRYFRTRFRSPAFRELGKVGDVDILIAGCGTGQHPIETARTFTGARVLAVDLSLASLGYAQRKTCEAGLTNLELAQADILKLGSIGRTFDVIESSGVLHHLADPMAGWEVLLSLLRPGGVMHLGFYSELGRAEIVAARAFIAERGYGHSAADIRQCRQELATMDDGASYRKLLGFIDFFSTSACRDLLFHVQEHRLTLPKIKAFLTENNLDFLGFELPAQTGEAFRRRFSDDGAMMDLDLWHIFEQENPGTFSGMYQFWIQKNSIGPLTW
jgi:Tfp pilus assembly protein PilF/SAM-dependent methyltransferase